MSERILVQIRGSDAVARVDRPHTESDVARQGGDEFAILLSHIESADDAGGVARRILEALPAPVSLEGHEISVTASIGIAVFPEDGDDAETLVGHADRAMYHAKEIGRNCHHFYDESLNEASVRRLALEGRLRRALEIGELAVHFQPRIDLNTGRVLGAEGLLRWEDEELGKVTPREIIPVAENSGLILPVGAWVLQTACEEARRWQDMGFPHSRVSVNVSPLQLTREDPRRTVSQVLQRTGLPPDRLELEITENTLLQDKEDVFVALRDLRAMGVRIALDDFGTGYSSLSYLSRFPLDVIKLDRTFVLDVPEDPVARAICKAVIEMGHTLEVRVVAEGVDAQEQADVLRELGCDELQGFLVSPAVPADEFLDQLRASEQRLADCDLPDEADLTPAEPQ